MRRLLGLLLVLAAACTPAPPTIVLAITTSVANSGLLEGVLPAYPGTVRPVQVGSGRALEMLATGSADVAISHAPEREAKALDEHPTWFYRKILHNDFLIVGPPSDPAKIAGQTDAVAAMKRIRESHQRFLSRGDDSGTHERERQLWAAAGVPATSDQVIVAGAGMGQTLRIASETGMYTLTDRGTFEVMSPSVRLQIVVAGDPGLLNTYAVLAAPSNDRGIRFARWLAEGDGRRVLADTLRDGQVRGFTLWPTERDGTRPDSRPF